MRVRMLLPVLPAALLLAACGGSGDKPAASGSSATGPAGKTIEIEMRDIAYAPTTIDVPAGQPVRLVFRNRGKVAHDAFVGDEAAQAEHESEMGAMGGMAHGGGDANAITVAPGRTGTLTRTFTAGERLLVGCHQPGHYAAGMKAAITAS